MTYDVTALVWTAFFLTLWGYALFLPQRTIRRVVQGTCLVLALLAMSPIVWATEVIIYIPPPCEDLPWYLKIVEPRCW